MLLLLSFAIAPAAPATAQGGYPSAPDVRETFVVSGTVVNSVTGEAIPRAMVRINGVANRSAFSDSEGRFQFENVPAGQIVLTAQKPSYFTEQDESGYSVLRPIMAGPKAGALSIKLVPQGAIFGRVLDASGQPIEHISLRLSARALRDGRKHWEQRGMTETDEEGHFRFANLNPGTYYLAVGPAQSEGRILATGEKPTTGFPHLYYPGVPDLISAAPLQLTAGQQMQADFSLNPVPVYHVSGNIIGQGSESRGVGVQVFTSSGDDLMLPTSFNMELGTFSLDSVPAGSYLLKAISTADMQPLRAEVKLNVASNLDGVHLALAPAVSIPIVVHMQSHASSGASPWNEDRPPVTVGLLPTQPNAAEAFSTFEQRGGRNVMLLPNVDSGSYTVNLMPQPPWYVQSASYGQTNVLYDDIAVTSGQSYPLEIVLRDDSASLTAIVRSPDNAPRPMIVLVAPQPATKAAPRILQGVSGSVTLTGLAPGDYLVYALDRMEGLEYANADALAAYASQAGHVTLTANQQGQVTLDLIHVGKGE